MRQRRLVPSARPAAGARRGKPVAAGSPAPPAIGRAAIRPQARLRGPAARLPGTKVCQASRASPSRTARKDRRRSVRRQGSSIAIDRQPERSPLSASHIVRPATLQDSGWPPGAPRTGVLAHIGRRARPGASRPRGWVRRASSARPMRVRGNASVDASRGADPPRRGIEMSITTTSGHNLNASSTASMPVAGLAHHVDAPASESRATTPWGPRYGRRHHDAALCARLPALPAARPTAVCTPADKRCGSRAGGRATQLPDAFALVRCSGTDNEHPDGALAGRAVRSPSRRRST